jgi:hypothetical protein
MQQVPPESGAPGESDTEEAIVSTDMNLLTGKSFLFIFWISHSFVLMNFGLFRNGLSEPSNNRVWGRRGRRGGGGSEYYEAVGGGGRGYGAGEEGCRGEEHQNFNHVRPSSFIYCCTTRSVIH